jgi:hypothetical protein
MLRITFPYLMLISLTAFSGAILNTYSRFWVAAFTPVFLNITMIATAIFLAPYLKVPIVSLAWGVFLAGIVQLLFQIPFLKRMGLLPRPVINFRDNGVTRVLKLMVPALFGVSVSQINLLLDTMFASFLAVECVLVVLLGSLDGVSVGCFWGRDFYRDFAAFVTASRFAIGGRFFFDAGLGAALCVIGGIASGGGARGHIRAAA